MTHASMKRAHATDNEERGLHDAKRQKIIRHHRIKHRQPFHEDPTLAPQDEAFFQSQLLRAISLNLSAVGFDGVKPTALEAFRAEVNEFMLHFLSLAKVSMNASRREQPIPQDFIFALSRHGLTPSSLLPHLDLSLPSITQPPIPPPAPAEPPPPDLEGLLGPELSGARDKTERRYIPKHFPALPSKHTWQATPVFTTRETDPRKVRERATQEGIMAEQALRKLMAASKSGQQHKESMKKQDPAKLRRQRMWEETMQAATAEDKEARVRHDRRAQQAEYHGFDGAADEMVVDRGGPAETTGEKAVDGGMLVNADRRYWRKTAQSATWEA